MNKYDFGYDLNKDDANLWAFRSIRQGSTVLEVGSSNGRLTKHLKEERSCIVDIVEINQEAGEDAMRFSRCSYLGDINGNIELPDVINRFPQNEYDYIVFLDVLEHLFDPELVLRRMKKLLKSSGKFVISIPNIAHNSVIINLINNRFHYTNVGLLDKTHLHFYTVDTVCQMIKDAGYYIQEISSTQKRVGDNEIENSYDDIPRDVAAFLRTRCQADVYQILVLAGKEEIKPEPYLFVKNLEYTLYKAQIYIGGTEGESLEFFVDPKMIELKFDIGGYDCQQPLRIDPIDRNCILKINKAVSNGSEGECPLSLVSTNGERLYNGEYVFWDDDPQIYFQCPEGTERVSLLFSCTVFDSSVLNHFKALARELLLALDREKDKKKQAELKEQYVCQYLDAIKERENALERLKQGILELNGQIEALNQENLTIKQQNQEIVNESKHLSNEISAIQQENRVIKNQNEDIQKINEDYMKQLDTLRKKLELVTYKKEELEKELCLEKDSLKVYTQRLNEANQTIRTVLSDNDDAKKRLAEANDELNKIYGHPIYKMINKVKRGH